MDFDKMVERCDGVSIDFISKLKESCKTSLLIDFVFKTQPMGTKTAQGNKLVLCSKEFRMEFYLYEEGIVRISKSKHTSSEIIIFYPFL